MRGKKIMAALLCASLLFGLGGCTKPVSILDPEPIDGGTTVHTDANAPKVIQSKDIRAFFANFYLYHRWRGDEERFFEFEIKLNDEGTLTATERNSGASLPADADLLTALQEVIDKYNLAAKNGIYEVTAGLPPEFQESTLRVSYESGESLTFTQNNNPEAKWAEAVYDVFAAWFSAHGDDILQPDRETSLLNRLDIRSVEGSIYLDYCGINVNEKDAIDGETYLLMWSVWDDEAQQLLAKEFILFPEDYYERVTEILAKYDLYLKYEQSWPSHDDGYYGMGDESLHEGEEDREDRRLDLYGEFESGNRFSIETKKESEIEGLQPMLDELYEYHASLFQSYR